jgi:UDP-3-O-[3-hydroxymyristoyl] glucosamine N-acyltransferase
MEFTAKMISDLVGGKVEGNPDVIIRQPAKIEEATEGSITFLANMQYEAHAYSTQASAILVSLDFEPKQPLHPTMIRVENVYETVRLLLEKFSEMQSPQPSQVTKVAATAFIHDTASIGEGTNIGTFSCIEKGAKIGKNTIIFPQVYIGEGAEIGDNVVLNAGVKIYKGCKIGNNCIIHANVVIGADGFGFVPQEDGTFKKMPQVGIVIIEENVEIGANTTVDRATMGATLIKKGTKLDNLIMVAHNVEIGENTAIAAQTGIAGSTKIGNNCMIGGQIAIVGHITVADGSQIQSKSGVAQSIKEPNKAWSGSPVIEYRNFWKSSVLFKQFPEIEKRIRKLEKALKEAENK